MCTLTRTYTTYNHVWPNSRHCSPKIPKINVIKKYVSENDNFYFYESLGNEIYYSLMKISTAVVGNSSSAILEAPSFKNLRILNVGLRQQGRIQANQILNCKPIKSEIKKMF